MTDMKKKTVWRVELLDEEGKNVIDYERVDGGEWFDARKVVAGFAVKGSPGERWPTDPMSSRIRCTPEKRS